MNCRAHPVPSCIVNWPCVFCIAIALSASMDGAAVAVAQHRPPTQGNAASTSSHSFQLMSPEELAKLPTDGRSVSLCIPAFRLVALLQDGAAPGAAEIRLEDGASIRVQFRQWDLHGAYDPNSGRLVSMRGTWRTKHDKQLLDVDRAEFPAARGEIPSHTADGLLDATPDGRWVVLRVGSADVRRDDSDKRAGALQLRTATGRMLTLLRPGMTKFDLRTEGELLLAGNWTKVGGDSALQVHEWFEYPLTPAPLSVKKLLEWKPDAASKGRTDEQDAARDQPVSSPVVAEGKFFRTLPKDKRDPNAPTEYSAARAYLISSDKQDWIGVNLAEEPAATGDCGDPGASLREPPPYRVRTTWIPLPREGQLVRVFGRVAQTAVGNRLMACEIVDLNP